MKIIHDDPHRSLITKTITRIYQDLFGSWQMQEQFFVSISWDPLQRQLAAHCPRSERLLAKPVNFFDPFEVARDLLSQSFQAQLGP